MSRIYIPSGGGYVLVPDGNKILVCDGANYNIPTEVRVCNGATYVGVWSKSDPITLNFYPTLTTTLRWNGSFPEYDGPGTAADNTKADLFLGRYNGSYPYHYTSLLRFAGASIEGPTLATALAARPFVKSATMRLHRVSGGYSSPTGYLRVGSWIQTPVESQPATSLNGSYHDWDPQQPNDVAGWSYGQNKTFWVPPQVVYDHNAGRAIMFSEVLSGYTSSGATTGAYMRIAGLTTSDGNKLPVLTVVLDVV